MDLFTALARTAVSDRALTAEAPFRKVLWHQLRAARAGRRQPRSPVIVMTADHLAARTEAARPAIQRAIAINLTRHDDGDGPEAA